jgi:hypothetical protein
VILGLRHERSLRGLHRSSSDKMEPAPIKLALALLAQIRFGSMDMRLNPARARRLKL